MSIRLFVRHVEPVNPERKLINFEFVENIPSHARNCLTFLGQKVKGQVRMGLLKFRIDAEVWSDQHAAAALPSGE